MEESMRSWLKFAAWMIGFFLPWNHAVSAADTATARYRVIVSTDIGGTDPDDYQSMVHLLLYADTFDLEGLISSPYGPGRKEHILRVIDHYKDDHPSLKSHSISYPTPEELRSIAKQGETESAPYAGFRTSTEGSNWIVRCARRNDTRPLYLLVWGGLEDLAQALHDAPDILPKLRVYWIGGPNKKWSANAYQHIVDRYPSLWFIESNSTYRGWFVGVDKQGPWSNSGFVQDRVAPHGSLGRFFASHLNGSMKMGDSPSVPWLLNGNPDDPAHGGWGGRYVRTNHRPKLELNRLPTEQDQLPLFGILELTIPFQGTLPEQPTVELMTDNQALAGHIDAHCVRIRFCPKERKVHAFVLRSNIPELNNLPGRISVVGEASPMVSGTEHDELSHWWTDDLDPGLALGPHAGAKTVQQHRQQFLDDFADRIRRCNRSDVRP